MEEQMITKMLDKSGSNSYSCKTTKGRIINISKNAQRENGNIVVTFHKQPKPSRNFTSIRHKTTAEACHDLERTYQDVPSQIISENFPSRNKSHNKSYLESATQKFYRKRSSLKSTQTKSAFLQSKSSQNLNFAPKTQLEKSQMKSIFDTNAQKHMGKFHQNLGKEGSGNMQNLREKLMNNLKHKFVS